MVVLALFRVTRTLHVPLFFDCERLRCSRLQQFRRFHPFMVLLHVSQARCSLDAFGRTSTCSGLVRSDSELIFAPTCTAPK